MTSVHNFHFSFSGWFLLYGVSENCPLIWYVPDVCACLVWLRRVHSSGFYFVNILVVVISKRKGSFNRQQVMYVVRYTMSTWI